MSKRFSNLNNKVLNWDDALRLRNIWALKGESVAFTNGCFDLLHYGHLHYLAQARDLGDRLVIGLNSADSVRRLKGSRRPIHDEATRFFQMASLFFVDLVVGFEEDTPLALIQTLQPDILVKGGDYQIQDIIGADFVRNRGGQVIILPFVQGYSTTSIEQKILQHPQ